MSTLADDLLKDFEDSGSENEDQNENEDGVVQTPPTTNGASPDGMILDDDEEAVEGEDASLNGDLKDAEDEDEAKAKVEKMELGRVSDVRSVAGLMKTLEPVLERIAHFQGQPAETSYVGNIEDNPEYHLLTQANTLSTSIDTEIILVHKYIRDHYSARFPELERLVQNPLDYAKTVAIIGNGPLDKDSIKGLAQRTDNAVGVSLNKILDGPSLMVVTVEASTSRGQDMPPAEVQRILAACHMTLNLDAAKKTLTDYVQSRMNMFAPNLTELIGSLTAAQLINFAGGIKGLAKMPACNLPALGSRKQALSGTATNVGIRKQGFVYHSPMIRTIPSHLKEKGQRIVSAKIVLAARVDSIHASRDGTEGRALLQKCLERLEKLTEPPPNRGQRALPAPDDKPARKRGGRRARKQKEATAMTDLQKERNRMAFGKEEQEVGYADSSKGMGMIGQKNDNRIRATQTDSRTRAKLSKNNKGWGGATPLPGGASSIRGFGSSAGSVSLAPGNGLRTSGVGAGDGTASTIAFTPVQGLELGAGGLKRKAVAAPSADKPDYFSGKVTSLGAGKEKDGFKIPALPAKKVKFSQT